MSLPHSKIGVVVHLDQVTQILVALSPVLVALLAGFFASRERRKRRSDTIMARLVAEIDALGNLPDGSEAKRLIEQQVDATASTYREACRLEGISRQPGAIALGATFTLLGVALGIWAGAHGGLASWWLLLALPLTAMGVFGFFYELGGGRNRDAETPEASDPDPTT
ncbi:hypothetical protein ACW14Y_22675 [Kitasatospora sp. cg17-2]